MGSRRATIQVEVRNQILWVGQEAYPVHNIARAQTVGLRPRRARAVFRFLGYAVLWLIVGVVLATVLRSSEVLGSSESLRVVPAIVGVLIIIHFIMMLRTLITPTLYALVIETSGSPHAALVTRNCNQLQVFVGHIMDAINNPRAAFGPVNIENFQDRSVQVFGGKVGNIGNHGSVGTIT